MDATPEREVDAATPERVRSADARRDPRAGPRFVPRPDAVQLVARQLRAGTYQPRVDDVAEQLMAWHFLDGGARVN